MKIFAKIVATGSYVPTKIVTNFDLCKEVGWFGLAFDRRFCQRENLLFNSY